MSLYNPNKSKINLTQEGQETHKKIKTMSLRKQILSAGISNGAWLIYLET